MKHDERERLLKEILAGEEVSGFRQASLERGLAAVRQARRGRALRTGALFALPVLLAAAILARHASEQRTTSSPSIPSVASVPSAPAPPRAAPPVKRINDEELFALFPDRSMALVGPPGQQQLVFLDQAGRKKVAPGL